MTQPNLFDDDKLDTALDEMQRAAHAHKFNEPRVEAIFAGPPVTAEEVTEEAIARVERNANQDWLDAFMRALKKVAREKLHFNTDSVWEAFEADYPQPDQHEPRAAGAVVRLAMKEGTIAATDMFWNSKRKSCHKRPLRVYRSLIFDGLDDDSVAH